jgi:hypothetical protein
VTGKSGGKSSSSAALITVAELLRRAGRQQARPFIDAASEQTLPSFVQ